MQKRGFISLRGKNSLNKKGLSEVVTTLLFVLLALGAVLLVWFVVRNLISGASKNVGLEEFNINLEVPAQNVYVDGVLKSVSFIVKRGAGEGTMDAVQVVLESASGQSTSSRYTFANGLNPLDSKAVSASYASIGDLKKISIAPIIKTADGTERMGSVAASADVSGINIGKALKLNGINQRVEVPNSASLNIYGENSLTLSAWIKINSLPSQGSVLYQDVYYWNSIFGKYQWHTNGWDLRVSNQGGERIFFDIHNGDFPPGSQETGTSFFAGRDNLLDRNWHNVVAVFNHQQDYVKIYWDGVQKASQTAISTYTIKDNSGAALWIGDSVNNVNLVNNIGTRYIDAEIDDMRIYNKALSPADITDKLYNSGMGDNLGSVRDGLVAWYKFDGDAKDSSGNGNDGALINNPTFV